MAIQHRCFTTKLLNNSLAKGHHMNQAIILPAYRERFWIDPTFDHAHTRCERLLVKLRVQQLRDFEEGYPRESRSRLSVGCNILSSVCCAAVMRSESFDDISSEPSLVVRATYVESGAVPRCQCRIRKSRQTTSRSRHRPHKRLIADRVTSEKHFPGVSVVCTKSKERTPALTTLALQDPA